MGPYSVLHDLYRVGPWRDTEGTKAIASRPLTPLHPIIGKHEVWAETDDEVSILRRFPMIFLHKVLFLVVSP